MNGTVTKAPPAPSRLERAPEKAPYENKPTLPGSSRSGFGFLLINIWIEVYTIKTAKKSDSQPVLNASKSSLPPTKLPAIIPGVKPVTNGQLIEPCL